MLDNLTVTDNEELARQVKMINSQQTGIVEEINSKLATVVFGAMRVKVELEKLTWIR